MKRVTLIVLSLLAPLLASSQGSFPLQVGNAWRYWWYVNIMTGGYETSKVIGDTLMPNGLTYFRYGSYLPGSYFRLSGDTVLAREHDDTLEFVLFHPRLAVGDTLAWPQRIYRYTKCIAVASIETTAATFNEMHGQHRRWTIRQYVEGDPPMPVVAWVIEDSVGLIYYEETGLTGAMSTLIGAQINGQSFGQMTAVRDVTSYIPETPLMLAAYPNPFNSETTVSVTSQRPGQLSVALYDLRGRRLKELLTQRVHSGTSTFVVMLSEYSSGVYILRATLDGTSSSVRVTLLR